VRPLLVTVAVLAIAVPLVGGCGGGSSSSTTSTIRSANEELASDLKSLGKPDLPRAQEAKNVVDNLADQIKADSDKISQALKNTSTVSEIVQGAAAISTSLVNLQTQVQSAVSQLNSIDKTDSLKNAFNDASACKALQSSS
jgi:polyhydroxyalkanoate synthesis regulator phasin